MISFLLNAPSNSDASPSVSIDMAVQRVGGKGWKDDVWARRARRKMKWINGLLCGSLRCCAPIQTNNTTFPGIPPHPSFHYHTYFCNQGNQITYRFIPQHQQIQSLFLNVLTIFTYAGYEVLQSSMIFSYDPLDDEEDFDSSPYQEDELDFLDSQDHFKGNTPSFRYTKNI